MVSPGAYVFFSSTSTQLVGGAEKQMFMIGKYLASQPRNQVSFAVADFGQSKKEVFDLIQTYTAFSYQESKLVGFLKLLKALKKTGADVFVFRGASIGTALAILCLKFIFFKKKVIYMMANSDEPVPARLTAMVGKPTAFFMGLAIRLVDRIAVQTEEQAELLLAYRKLKASVVIRNMVKIPSEKAARRSTIIWVGRAVAWKRPHLFLDLAEQNPDFDFVMICPFNFDTVLFQELKARAEGLKNLNFIESVSPEKIGEFFSEAILYCITSISEGFPNTMLEAFSYGVPALSLGIDPDGVIARYDLGKVVHTYDDLNKSLKSFLAQKTVISRTSENAYRYAKEFHSKEAVGEKMNQLFKEF